MSPEEIAAGFRTAELQRREARRKILLNHAALDEEELTSPVDIRANAEALKRISLHQLEYERQLAALRPRVGYWRRLWLALLNKDPS